MSSAWVPVFLAAIIVLGVVGGQLALTVLKKVLPLLETLVQQRQKGIAGADVAALRQEISDLEGQVAQLEASDRRLENLEEEVSFLRSLLEARGEKSQLPSDGSDRS